MAEPGIPPSPEAWGWEGREFRSGDGETGVSYRGRGHKIGWVAGDELYLDPDSTHAALVELARDQGQTLPVSAQTLFKRLKQSGFLIRTEHGRTTYPVTAEGTRRRVLVVSTTSIFPIPGQPGQPGPASQYRADSVPLLCPSLQNGGAEPVQETGTESRESPASVPAVPVIPVSGKGNGAGASGGIDAHRHNDDSEVFKP